MHGAIEIVRAPAGEAPDWVREAWVGLTLPLAERGLRAFYTSGVRSGPKTVIGSWWYLLTGRLKRSEGYVVMSAVAVELLGAVRPDAADWWRGEADGFYLCPNTKFIFDAPACRELGLTVSRGAGSVPLVRRWRPDGRPASKSARD